MTILGMMPRMFMPRALEGSKVGGVSDMVSSAKKGIPAKIESIQFVIGDLDACGVGMTVLDGCHC
jgi:hypothetical protein